MDLKNIRFENLPLTTQVLIFGILALALSAIFYMYFLQDPMAQKAQLESEVSDLEQKVAQGTAIHSRLKQFKAELVQLDARLEVLKAILPSNKETPVVLQSVQEMAAASNLKILKFHPQPIVPRAFYSDWPIQLEVQGSYDSLRQFFSKISQSTRIINVDNISIKGIDGSTDPRLTLSATCTATTFVFREEQAAPPAAQRGD